MTFRLTKHHGLGKDLPVFLTEDPVAFSDDAWADRARRWCDRHTGIGADGLLRRTKHAPQSGDGSVTWLRQALAVEVGHDMTLHSPAVHIANVEVTA